MAAFQNLVYLLTFFWGMPQDIFFQLESEGLVQKGVRIGPFMWLLWKGELLSPVFLEGSTSNMLMQTRGMNNLWINNEGTELVHTFG